MNKRFLIFYRNLIFPCFLTIKPILGMQDSFISIDEIRGQLVKHIQVADNVKNQEITVFIGNTGVGKSTLINLAAGTPLRVTNNGKIVIDGDVPNAPTIGPGPHSVTLGPEYFYSQEVGHIYDLPGFMDTGGAVRDILNASAIRGVLTSARGVRVILVTNTGELEEAARGRVSKEFDKAVGMFSDNFLRGPSCAVIVNSVEREIIDQNNQDSNILGLLGNLENIGKIKKRLLLKKARVGDQKAFVEELKSTLLQSILPIQQESVGALDMSRTFDSEANHQITAFLVDAMHRHMGNSQETRYKKIIDEIMQTKKQGFLLSKELADKQGIMWFSFQKDISLTPEYKLLYEICRSQYAKAFDDFRPSFDNAHLSIVHTTEIKEKQAEKEAAEKAKKDAEYKAEQSAHEANAAKEQAFLREREKLEAENRERMARIEAEKAQKDAAKSKEEKEQAQQAAQKAVEDYARAEANFKQSMAQLEEKTRKAQLEQDKLKEAAEEAKKRAEDLEKHLKEQEERRNRELRDMRMDLENERLRNEQQLAKIRKQGDEAAQKYERELERLREDHRRAEDDMLQRHQMEIAAASQKEDTGINNFLEIIKAATSTISTLFPLFSKK